MKKEWKDRKDRKVLYVHGSKRFITSDEEIYGFDKDILISLKERYLYLGSDIKFIQFGISVDKSYTVDLINLKENGIDVIPAKYYLKPYDYKCRNETKRIIFEAVCQCDILIARVPSFIAYFAQEAAIKYKKPYILEVVACPWDALWNYSNLAKLIAPLALYRCKKSVAKAGYAMYVSNEFLQKRYPNAKKTCAVSDVILQEVPDDIFKKKIERLSSINDKYIITTLAAVDVLYKGQQTVIEAIALLKKKGYHVEYHIAGSGDRTRLKNIAERFGVVDQVIFEGMLTADQVFELLDNTDIYVQPSKQEGLPRAVVEAMSRGCVCIGSYAGGIPELLDDICLFDQGSVKQIVRILEKLLQDKELRSQQSKTNFENAKKFRHTLLEQKRRAFYDEFISEHF